VLRRGKGRVRRSIRVSVRITVGLGIRCMVSFKMRVSVRVPDTNR